MKKISWSSVLIGSLTFGLLGFSIFNMLTRLDIIQTSSVLKFLLPLSFGLFGAYIGWSKPLLTELVSFGLTTLIMVQAFWDSSYDIQAGFSEPRVTAGIIALGIFLLNTFTGKFKRGTAKKQIRKLLGLR